MQKPLLHPVQQKNSSQIFRRSVDCSNEEAYFPPRFAAIFSSPRFAASASSLPLLRASRLCADEGIGLNTKAPVISRPRSIRRLNHSRAYRQLILSSKRLISLRASRQLFFLRRASRPLRPLYLCCALRASALMKV